MSLHLCPILSSLYFFINSLPVLYFFPLNYRCQNNEHGNEEDMGDDDLPPDLLRLVEQDERQILPHQEITEAVNLGTEEERKDVKIETTLSLATRKELIDLLQDYIDVFAWSYQDMPSLDIDIVVHRLPLREECAPVKQKLRRVKPEMLLKIKEEVKKQLDTGFLKWPSTPNGWPI